MGLIGQGPAIRITAWLKGCRLNQNCSHEPAELRCLVLDVLDQDAIEILSPRFRRFESTPARQAFGHDGSLYICTGHGGNDQLCMLINAKGIDDAREHFCFSILEFCPMRTDESGDY